jgi:hypothetical protein
MDAPNTDLTGRRIPDLNPTEFVLFPGRSVFVRRKTAIWDKWISGGCGDSGTCPKSPPSEDVGSFPIAGNPGAFHGVGVRLVGLRVVARRSLSQVRRGCSLTPLPDVILPNMPRTLVIIPIFLEILSAGAASPRFSDYPVTNTFRGHPATPKFHRSGRWDADPKFRDSVRFSVARGPNFAGSFTIVEAPCGTGCAYVSIVDARTGRIFENLPFAVVQVGDPPFLGLSFRLRSRLLMVEGYVDTVGERDEPKRSAIRAYYEWTGTELRLIERRRVTETR